MKRKGLFLLAKFIILVVTILHVIPVVWDLPASYRQLRMLQPNSGLSGWTQTELQSAAQSAGLSPQFLGTVLFTASLTCLLAFWVMAALMYWFKGNSWIGLLSMYILSGTGVGFAFLIIDRAVLPGWATGFYNFTAALLWPTFFMLIYLFPDGHFVPRWSRFLAPFPFIVFVFAAWYGDEKTPGWFLGLLLLYLLGGLISQSYRYRRASSAEQRQQTKWVFYAMAVLVVNVILGKVAPLLFPALAAKTGAGFYYDVGYNYLLGVLFSALLPISIGFSILRYRLWDIDVLIRRTLVYGLLTAILALLYLGSVVILEQLFRGLIGQGSDLAIILSTLSCAVLFTPLRQRIQNGIDHRFYRRKYDTEKVLANFGASAQNEVELNRLSQELLQVVDENMQPKKVMLWLQKGIKS